MTDNYKDDEIDLIELIMTLWQGKLLISIFTVLSVSLAVIFKLVSPPPTFTATTRIYPIPDIIEQQYILLNQFEYFDFDANYFLLSYVNELQRSEVFDEVILDSGIIEIEGDEFGEDISSTIADYKDKLSVSYIENDVEPASLGHYEVTFVHNDEQEWLTALALLNERLNLLVKSRVDEYFENVVMQVETAANQRLED